jgi:hypothetical protein
MLSPALDHSQPSSFQKLQTNLFIHLKVKIFNKQEKKWVSSKAQEAVFFSPLNLFCDESKFGKKFQKN